MLSKRLLSVCALVLVIIGPMWLGGCATQNRGKYGAFVEAARAANVEVRPDEIVSITSGTDTLVTAPVVSWEQMPSTSLNRGVDVAFLYSSATSGRFPPGYYTVRAFADVTKVGRIDGTFELIDRQGNVAAKVPATMEIHSLGIPQGTARRSFATITEETDAQGLRIRITIYCCSNGTCTITISW